MSVVRPIHTPPILICFHGFLDAIWSGAVVHYQETLDGDCGCPEDPLERGSLHNRTYHSPLKYSKIFGVVPALAHAVARLVAAGEGDAVLRAVEERVVDADVVGAALHAGLVPLDLARLAVGVHEAGVASGMVLGARAAAPEAREAEALLDLARAGGARRGVGAGHVAEAAGAPRARRGESVVYWY